MTDEQALMVIQALADGADPFTGEMLPTGSLWHNAEVVRALFRAAELLEKAARREERRGDLPARAGKPWDEEESKLLIERYENRESIKALAKLHERTRGGIESQLAKLGKIPMVRVYRHGNAGG
jgi:hypothetical protein